MLTNKIRSALILIPLFLVSNSLPANSEEETLIGTLDKNYLEKLENKQFKKAFDYLKNPKNRTAELQLALHYLLGTGTNIDICKAVSILEKNYNEAGIIQMSLLNFAYNSSWKTIAALEGNHNAAFMVGHYYYGLRSYNKNTMSTLLDVNDTFLRNAYIHFKRAKKFGDVDAEAFIEKILKERPDFEQSVTVDYSKTSIICPIRN